MSFARVAPLALLALLAASTALAQGGPLERGRDTVQQAIAAHQASTEAMANQNAAEAETLRKRAAQLLREAKALFVEARAPESTDPALLAEYAELLLTMDERDLAAETLRDAARLDPENPNAWLYLARVEATLGSAGEKEAFKHLQRVLKLDATSPAAAEAHVELGHLYTQNGLYELAEEAFATGLALSPENPLGRIGAAAVEVRRGLMTQASQRLDTLTVLTPGQSVKLQELLTLSLRDFERSRILFPDTADAHLSYAKILLRAGRLPACIAPLERSLALDPGNYIAWNLLGSVSRGLGDLPAARHAFQQSLEAEPGQPRTQQAIEDLDALK